VWPKWSSSVRIRGEKKVPQPAPPAAAAERICDLFNAALNHGSSVHSATKIQYFFVSARRESRKLVIYLHGLK
jgi:hypothetical protein